MLIAISPSNTDDLPDRQDDDLVVIAPHSVNATFECAPSTNGSFFVHELEGKLSSLPKSNQIKHLGN